MMGQGVIAPVLPGWMADVASFGWALNTNALLVVVSAVTVALLAREPVRRARGG